MFEESENKGKEVKDQSEESAKKKEEKNVSKHLNCNYLGKVKKIT